MTTRVKLEYMSDVVVEIIKRLSSNEGLARLLINNTDNPLEQTVTDEQKKQLFTFNSDESKIYPFPFNPVAETEDGSFIRVYYNYGEFNENEVIVELDLYVDIVVAKSLWLMNNRGKSLIRPYEIAGRVIELIGRRGVGGRNNIGVRAKSIKHLEVNNKFIWIICLWSHKI